MNVTRDVILDLLPLYLSEEASTDTKALVKAHLDGDPDLARLAEGWQGRLSASPPVPAQPDAQAQAYLEAKRWIAIKTVGVAAVIAVGFITLTALAGAMFFTFSG